MSQPIFVLIITAVTIAFLHTFLGPDHYLPFIVMSKSGQWSVRKTVLITFFCGIGHILGSVLLGFVGIALGVTLSRLTKIESFRGEIAAWGLIAFGLVYTIWGLRKAFRNQPHSHTHVHFNGVRHEHIHVHQGEHVHFPSEKPQTTVWALFLILCSGPVNL